MLGVATLRCSCNEASVMMHMSVRSGISNRESMGSTRIVSPSFSIDQRDPDTAFRGKEALLVIWKDYIIF